MNISRKAVLLKLLGPGLHLHCNQNMQQGHGFKTGGQPKSQGQFWLSQSPCIELGKILRRQEIALEVFWLIEKIGEATQCEQHDTAGELYRE